MSILLRPVACFIPRNLLDRTSSHVFMMVASDATSSFTTRASNEIDMVLDPLVVCGPSGVGKVCSDDSERVLLCPCFASS